MNTELSICDGLHQFIEYRKFQLPAKGRPIAAAALLSSFYIC